MIKVADDRHVHDDSKALPTLVNGFMELDRKNNDWQTDCR